MRKGLWIIVIALAAACFAGGYWAGQRAAVGSQAADYGEPTDMAPTANMPADLGGEAGLGAEEGEGELPGPPQGDEAADAAQVAVAMAFPGWDAKVVRHSDDWQTATVRATSPDGKTVLDFDVEWDSEIAGYAIVSARAAKVAPASGSAQGGVKLPAGIMAAVKANPKLKAAAGGQVTVERLTSGDALLTLAGGGQKWRVYLKRAGEGWVVKNAKRLG